MRQGPPPPPTEINLLLATPEGFAKTVSDRTPVLGVVTFALILFTLGLGAALALMGISLLQGQPLSSFRPLQSLSQPHNRLTGTLIVLVWMGAAAVPAGAVGALAVAATGRRRMVKTFEAYRERGFLTVLRPTQLMLPSPFGRLCAVECPWTDRPRAAALLAAAERQLAPVRSRQAAEGAGQSSDEEAAQALVDKLTKAPPIDALAADRLVSWLPPDLYLTQVARLGKTKRLRGGTVYVVAIPDPDPARLRLLQVRV
jgi:hypothetical protein